MTRKKKNENIQLATPQIIFVEPTKHESKPTKKQSKVYGILTEKRFPKVKSDETKLYNTTKTHKYY